MCGYLSSCQLLTFKAFFCEEKLLCILNGYQNWNAHDVDYIHLGVCTFELILNIIMYVVKLTLHNIRSSMQNRHTQWKYKFFGLIYIECPFIVIAYWIILFLALWWAIKKSNCLNIFVLNFMQSDGELMKLDVVCCRVWPETQKVWILLNNLIWIWQTKIHAWISARKGYNN